jgi:hypothetical protein
MMPEKLFTMVGAGCWHMNMKAQLGPNISLVARVWWLRPTSKSWGPKLPL